MKKNIYQFLIVIALATSTFGLRAQQSMHGHAPLSNVVSCKEDYDDEEMEEYSIWGLSFGLNIGAYFGNPKTAAVYNGAGPFQGYINEAAMIRWYSIPERIGMDGAFQNDPNTVNVIKDFYNTQNYGFNSDFASSNMRYNPAMYVGLNLKWNFNRYAAIVMNMNAAKLKAVGQFTMQVTPSSQNNQFNSGTQLLSVAGEEQRFNLNLGYRQGWMMGDMSNFFVQVGGSMLGTKWMSNYALVADRQFDLITQSFVAGQQTLEATPNTGVGFGAYIETGVEFWIGKYSFDLGFGFSRDKVIIYTLEENVTNKWLQATFNI
jgi:hypothetical protein